jgi:hypothetical protein
MEYPDVCGYTLIKAKQMLKDKGYQVEKVKILKPPRDNTLEYDDSYRVVKVKLLDESNIEVLVCKPL